MSSYMSAEYKVMGLFQQLREAKTSKLLYVGLQKRDSSRGSWCVTYITFGASTEMEVARKLYKEISEYYRDDAYLPFINFIEWPRPYIQLYTPMVPKWAESEFSGIDPKTGWFASE